MRELLDRAMWTLHMWRQAEVPITPLFLVRDFTTERPGPHWKDRAPLRANGAEQNPTFSLALTLTNVPGFPKIGKHILNPITSNEFDSQKAGVLTASKDEHHGS
jgi:hypothetical protein